MEINERVCLSVIFARIKIANSLIRFFLWDVFFSVLKREPVFGPARRMRRIRRRQICIRRQCTGREINTPGYVNGVDGFGDGFKDDSRRMDRDRIRCDSKRHSLIRVLICRWYVVFKVTTTPQRVEVLGTDKSVDYPSGCLTKATMCPAASYIQLKLEKGRRNLVDCESSWIRLSILSMKPTTILELYSKISTLGYCLTSISSKILHESNAEPLLHTAHVLFLP